METLKLVNAAFEHRELLTDAEYREAIQHVMVSLDAGYLRCASPIGDDPISGWMVHEWIKKAILLYFSIQEMQVMEVGPYEFHDKMPLKRGYAEKKVRVVPPAVARFGAYLAPGVILMPSYVNIGAYVGEGTMVDTWATVGSCAQIGAQVHLSGGVGIGGVLEPLQASPVIIEDGAFIGSRAIIVEGVRVGKGAVIGAGVTITASTRIIDVTGKQPVEHKGFVPPLSVVIPGSMPKPFPAGTYSVPCAIIIGKRTESTNLKTSLNQALREFDVPV
jgi:2,3,4,5-tetrahydropyridine-2,6-dicarboxylate N-succinyltransferase